MKVYYFDKKVFFRKNKSIANFCKVNDLDYGKFKNMILKPMTEDCIFYEISKPYLTTEKINTSQRKRASEIKYYILDDKKIVDEFGSFKKGSMQLFGNANTLTTFRRLGVTRTGKSFNKLEKYIMINADGERIWENKRTSMDNISFFDKKNKKLYSDVNEFYTAKENKKLISQRELTELEKQGIKKVLEITINNPSLKELIDYLYKNKYISEDFKNSINLDKPIIFRNGEKICY